MKLAVAPIMAFSLLGLCSYASGGEALGIGFITNTTSRASESFKLHQIFSSLELKSAANKKIDILFADNPSLTTYYITGQIRHFRRTYDKDHNLPNGIIIIDNKKDANCIGYMTTFRLQLWTHGKFVENFTDSALYIPSYEEQENEPMKYGNFSLFYDEGYKLYSPLLFHLINEFGYTWDISVGSLRKSEILKFDVKPRGDGHFFNMQDFLPAKHILNEKVPSSVNSFNFYFENAFETVARKELFFLSNYGSGTLNTMVAQVSYPKTSWKAATESYLELAARNASGDVEIANMANWSALILSSQLKDKVSIIYACKARALNNILDYSKKKGYSAYSRLLVLDLALTEGFLQSSYCRMSDAHFDSTFSSLSYTFSSTQDAMNSMRAQNRVNSIINGINMGAAMLSAANDGAHGYNTSSATTNELAKNYLETSKKMDLQMQDAISSFRVQMNGLDFSLPLAVLQANGEDNVNIMKSFLFLECLKLIYIDKSNEYWRKAYEDFCSSSPEMLREFLSMGKNKQLSDSDLKAISNALLKYEQYSFLTDKLHAQ